METLLLNALILFILVAGVALFTALERQRLGAWVTPFSVLAVPYTIVVLLAVCFAAPLGFYAPYAPSLLVWVAGLFAWWFAGLAVTAPFGRAVRAQNRRPRPFAHEEGAQKLALAAAVVIIPMVGMRAASLVGSFGLSGISSIEFARAYGSGITAHMMVVGYALLTLLIGTVTRRKWAHILVIAALYAFLALYQAKSWMVVPLVAGLLYRWLSGRLRITLRMALLFLGVMVVIFFGSYLVGFGATDARLLVNPGTYAYLFRHFFHYLFAGVLSLSEYVANGVQFDLPTAKIFSPFVNLYAVVTGRELVLAPNPLWLQIENMGRSANVFTFFGSLLLVLGWNGMLLYTLVVSVLVHALYCGAILTRNCWLVVWWVFVGAMLAMGWFEFYFWLLAAIEVSVFCALMAAGAFVWRLITDGRAPPQSAAPPAAPALPAAP